MHTDPRTHVATVGDLLKEMADELQRWAKVLLAVHAAAGVEQDHDAAG